MIALRFGVASSSSGDSSSTVHAMTTLNLGSNLTTAAHGIRLVRLGDLDDVGAISELVAASDALDRELEDRVTALREAGASWSTVGEALGISKQGAHKRYSGRVGRRLAS